MSRHRITQPSASLELIAKANGQKTGDELRLEERDRRHAANDAINAVAPRPLRAREIRELTRRMAEAGKDVFGRPLQEGERQ